MARVLVSTNGDPEGRLLYPAGEQGLRVCEQDTDARLPALVKLVPEPRIAVQAGGAVGVWPMFLANYFAHVYTFEPNPALFYCLVHNSRGHHNMSRLQAALGAEPGMCRMEHDPKYHTNMGAWQTRVAGGGTIPILLIDYLDLQACDLIALDVEGSELDVLKGAYETIERHHPVISIEDKGISRPRGEVPDWLAYQFGYQPVAQLGNDVVLK
jgi:FkbM family methyltransferase